MWQEKQQTLFLISPRYRGFWQETGVFVAREESANENVFYEQGLLGEPFSSCFGKS